LAGSDSSTEGGWNEWGEQWGDFLSDNGVFGGYDAEQSDAESSLTVDCNVAQTEAPLEGFDVTSTRLLVDFGSASGSCGWTDEQAWDIAADYGSVLPELDAPQVSCSGTDGGLAPEASAWASLDDWGGSNEDTSLNLVATVDNANATCPSGSTNLTPYQANDALAAAGLGGGGPVTYLQSQAT
jgi:hypothetical protein